MEFNDDGTLKTPNNVEKNGNFYCWRCNALLDYSDDVCINCNPKEGAKFLCKSCEKRAEILLEDGLLICSNCRAIKGRAK